MTVMKKVFISTIAIYLIIRIISSCAMKEVYEGSINQALIDSTGLNNPLTIEPFDLEIIPPSLGVQFYRDGIIFLGDSKNEGNLSSGHVSFGVLQAYYAALKDTLGQHFVFSPKIAFQYPCDALTFSPDFGTMYYTKTYGKEAREKIFRAENFMIGENRQMWTYDAEPLDFCKEGSIYSHPSISVDGSYMVFASDMKGSFGGMDLFITRNINMKWAEPESLGKIINTRGDEISPFLDRNNNLFFSSNGRKGSGGYDIFLCKFNGKGWDLPVRITNSINTKNDEFAFVVDRLTGNSAFYTSMKSSKNPDLQLYRISLNKKIQNTVNADVTALLYNMSASNIDSSEIKLMLKQLAAEKTRADSIEAARIKTERLKAEKIRNDSIAAAKLAVQKANELRLQAIKHRSDSIAVAKLSAQKLQADRLKAEKLRSDSIAAAKLSAQKLQADILKAEKLRNDSIVTAKLAAQKLQAERIKAANKLKTDSIEAERLRTQRIITEKMSAEKRKADSIATIKLIAQKREAERLRIEKLRTDSIAAAKLEAYRLNAARTEAEKARIAKLQADSIDAARIKRQKAEAERIKAEKLKSASVLAAEKEAQRLESAKIKAREDSINAARVEAFNKGNKDVVIYKVQFLSSVKPKVIKEILVNGKKYSAVKYFYLNEYRYTIGEFNSLRPAVNLQNTCRKYNYPHAFVVAFKNGTRTLDMAVFKYRK